MFFFFKQISVLLLYKQCCCRASVSWPSFGALSCAELQNESSVQSVRQVKRQISFESAHSELMHLYSFFYAWRAAAEFRIQICDLKVSADLMQGRFETTLRRSCPVHPSQLRHQTLKHYCAAPPMSHLGRWV